MLKLLNTPLPGLKVFKTSKMQFLQNCWGKRRPNPTNRRTPEGERLLGEAVEPARPVEPACPMPMLKTAC